MTIRRVLSAVLVLVGASTLVLSVLGTIGGNGTPMPFALLGLVLCGLGIRLLAGPRRHQPHARRARGGYAVTHHPYAPTGNAGWSGPVGSDDHHSRWGSSGGGWSGSDGGSWGGSDGGSSGGGWSGSDSGGHSGGGDSGGSY